MDTLMNYLPQIFLFGSVIYFYIGLLIFMAILFYTDAKEMGFHAFFFSIVFFGLLYWKGSFNLFEFLTWGMVGTYLGIGFIHSLIRTYFYGRKPERLRRQDKESDESYRKRIVENKQYYLKGNVFRWWFLFPISLMNWILSDLVKEVYDYVYSKLKKLYDSILTKGVDSYQLEKDK
jgi:hypothetical protein